MKCIITNTNSTTLIPEWQMLPHDKAVLKAKSTRMEWGFEMYVLTSFFMLFIKLNVLQKPISSVETVEASFKESLSRLAYTVVNHGDSTVNLINLTWLVLRLDLRDG